MVILVSDLMRLLKPIDESGLVTWAPTWDYHVDHRVVIADKVDVILDDKKVEKNNVFFEDCDKSI